MIKTKSFLDGKVLLMSFPTRKDMNLSMMRISEFQESKHETIKGRYFTHEEFLDAYTTSEGEFNYLEFWEGFNVSKELLARFDTTFPDKTPREKEVLKVFRESTAGYLIAADTNDYLTLDHELAHARFYLDEEYRNEQLNVIRELRYDHYSKLKLDLSSHGYSDDVLDDEIQAYLKTGRIDELKTMFPSFTIEELISLQRKFFSKNYHK